MDMSLFLRADNQAAEVRSGDVIGMPFQFRREVQQFRLGKRRVAMRIRCHQAAKDGCAAAAQPANRRDTVVYG